jgi:hypothetical protein
MTNASDTLTCKVMGRPATAVVYNKREAEWLQAELQSEHGGHWSTERVGHKWRVYQIVTREEYRRNQAKSSAEIALHPRFNWFSPDGYRSIYRTRDQLKVKLDEWVAQFARDPVYALKYGTENCQNAADFQVASQIIAYYEAGLNPRDICHDFEEEARRAVESDNLNQSTSPMSNLMEQARRIALGKFSRDMRSWLQNQDDAIGTLYAETEGWLLPTG